MTDLVNDHKRCDEDQPTLRAAMAWEAAARKAEQQQRWTQADQARLRWALCLHNLGRCEQAVTVLRQAPDAASVGRRDGFVVAMILCMRLLKRCRRQDQAGAVWSAMERTTTSAVRRWALIELLSPANHDLNNAGARGHGAVCVYRRREVLGATTQSRR
jgi:thioredoxin-like negative regulator of GroEL